MSLFGWKFVHSTESFNPLTRELIQDDLANVNSCVDELMIVDHDTHVTVDTTELERQDRTWNCIADSNTSKRFDDLTHELLSIVKMPLDRVRRSIYDLTEDFLCYTSHQLSTVNTNSLNSGLVMILGANP